MTGAELCAVVCVAHVALSAVVLVGVLIGAYRLGRGASR